MLPKSCQKCQQCSIFWHFWALIGTFWDFCAFFWHYWEHFRHFITLLLFFCNLSVTYTNFVCRSDSVRRTNFLFDAVIQCDKLNFCLLQWLSATNNTEKNILFLWCMWQRNWKKKPKTNILPNLNFTSAIKLLSGTLIVVWVILLPKWVYLAVMLRGPLGSLGIK